LLLLAGCDHLKQFQGTGETQAVRPAPQQTTAEGLVAWLNDNSHKLQSIDCGELDLDARQKLEAVSLRGWMVCQKSKNFRMGAKIVGNQAVDMGSNDQEFWWWISKGDPYLFHCSHDDLANNRVRVQLPFQPEWMMQALGMAEYGPAQNYTVNVTQNGIELIEQSKSPSGQPVRKVTVFARGVAQVPAPQVTAYILQDGAGKVICAAYVTEVQRDAATGITVPKRVRLECPAEHMELKMTLHGVTVNQPIDQQRAARLFTRPQLANVPTFDLARGPDQPQGQAIRPTSGFEPQR
jgi:hypothetical protein